MASDADHAKAHQGGTRIDTLAEEIFEFRDDAHRIVTFLNKTLKYRNLIFGLTRGEDGAYKLRVYEVVPGDTASGE